MMRFSILLSFFPICSALASEMPKFQLQYFNARGAAEGIRILFALGDEEYDDIRFDITPGTMDSPAFKTAKEGGKLAMNLDRAPILVTPEGVTIGQSKAIERFLARRYGLMGSNDVEAAQIDCVVEHCRDVRDARMRKRFSAFVKDRSEEDKAQAKEEWFETDMPALLAKIEATIKETGKATGFAVGSSISWADLAIFSLLKDCFPVYKEDTFKAAEDCPSLLAIDEAVAFHPKVNKWLEERPHSSF
jgi:glutathione S-transferase